MTSLQKINKELNEFLYNITESTKTNKFQKYNKTQREFIKNCMYQNQKDPVEYANYNKFSGVNNTVKFIEKLNTILNILDLSHFERQNVLNGYYDGEYIKNQNTLFLLYMIELDGQYSLHDIQDKFNIGDYDTLEKYTLALSINFPNYITYSNSLDLDTLTVYPNGQQI